MSVVTHNTFQTPPTCRESRTTHAVKRDSTVRYTKYSTGTVCPRTPTMHKLRRALNAISDMFIRTRAGSNARFDDISDAQSSLPRKPRSCNVHELTWPTRTDLRLCHGRVECTHAAHGGDRSSSLQVGGALFRVLPLSSQSVNGSHGTACSPATCEPLQAEADTSP